MESKKREVNEIAEAVSVGLHQLGLNRSDTNLGAIELLAKEVLDSGEKIMEELYTIGSGIERVAEAGERIAEAIELQNKCRGFKE